MPTTRFLPSITSSMRHFLGVLRLAVCFAAIAGCGTSITKLRPVGPEQETRQHPPEGWLMVFTASESRMAGDTVYYSLPTPYSLMRENGEFLRRVPNHFNSMDETPTIIRVEVGNYLVRAQSEGFGIVRVAVEIKAGRLTEVHLDGSKRPWKSNQTSLVRRDDGKILGWQADRPEGD